MTVATFINVNDGYERFYFKIGEHFFLCLQVEGKEVICYDCNNEQSEPNDKLEATKIFFMGYRLRDDRISNFIERNNETYSENYRLNNAKM